MEQLHDLDVLRIESEKAFREVFTQLHTRLCYFATSLLAVDWSAEDVVQEAFVKLWERKADFSNIRSIKSFLYITVRNQCFNINKHQKVVEKHQRFIHTEEIQQPGYDKQSLIEAEVLDKIHQALQQLPQGCRTVMHFSYFEGMRNKDIAARLKVSINTVKTQKKRALHLLRTSINILLLSCLSWMNTNSF